MHMNVKDIQQTDSPQSSWWSRRVWTANSSSLESSSRSEANNPEDSSKQGILILEILYKTKSYKFLIGSLIFINRVRSIVRGKTKSAVNLELRPQSAIIIIPDHFYHFSW